MPKFTEGPWIRSNYGFQVLTNDREKSICSIAITGSIESQRADAQLISAAPDMYEALYRVKSFLSELRQFHNIYGWSGEKAILDAIAKAEGGNT